MKKDLIYLSICIITIFISSIITIYINPLYKEIKNTNLQEKKQNIPKPGYIFIPYAKEEIYPRTRLTNELLGTIEVPLSSIANQNIAIDIEELLNSKNNYCVISNTKIPATSYIYLSNIGTCLTTEESKNYTIKLANNHPIINHIEPNTFVDLYLKTINNDRLTYGCLLKDILVTDINNSENKLIFTTVNYQSKYNLETLIAKINSSSDINIIPVIKDSFSSGAKTKIYSSYLADMILKGKGF